MRKMEKDKVLYKNSNGETIRYESGEGPDIMAYMQTSDGRDYPVARLGNILAFSSGGWQVVYFVDEEKKKEKE